MPTCTAVSYAHAYLFLNRKKTRAVRKHESCIYISGDASLEDGDVDGGGSFLASFLMNVAPTLTIHVAVFPNLTLT